MEDAKFFTNEAFRSPVPLRRDCSMILLSDETEVFRLERVIASKIFSLCKACQGRPQEGGHHPLQKWSYWSAYF